MSVRTLDQAMQEQQRKTEMKEAEAETAAPERTLDIVAAEIRALTASALNNILEIGRRMHEAKEMLPHGEFGKWLEENTDYSTSTANNFMRLFDAYADDQGSLFGASVANFQTFGNLSYSKALALLAVPAEEREEFVKENDVGGMSTRELQAAIKERDEARRVAEEAKVEQRLAEEARDKMEQDMAHANERVAGLQQELEELRKNGAPRESDPSLLRGEEAGRNERTQAEGRGEGYEASADEAVEGADPEAIAKAREEGIQQAEERLKGELEKARVEAEKAKEALEKAKTSKKDELAKAEAKVKDAEDAKQQAIQEREQVQLEFEKVRKELAASGNKAVVAFGIHFAAVQEEMEKLLGCLDELEQAGDTENREKLVKAYTALMERFGKAVETAHE